MKNTNCGGFAGDPSHLQCTTKDYVVGSYVSQPIDKQVIKEIVKEVIIELKQEGIL